MDSRNRVTTCQRSDSGLLDKAFKMKLIKEGGKTSNQYLKSNKQIRNPDMSYQFATVIVNYGRELRIRINIRRKEKMKKAMEFAKRMKKVQEEVEAALKRTQEKIKKQADKGRKKAEVWKVGNKVMLSTKDLMFKKWPVKRLVDRYIGPYIINKIVSTNTIKLQLPTSIRIYPVVNVSQVVQYKKQVRKQKVEEIKLVKVEEVKE